MALKRTKCHLNDVKKKISTTKKNHKLPKPLWPPVAEPQTSVCDASICSTRRTLDTILYVNKIQCKTRFPFRKIVVAQPARTLHTIVCTFVGLKF